MQITLSEHDTVANGLRQELILAKREVEQLQNRLKLLGEALVVERAKMDAVTEISCTGNPLVFGEQAFPNSEAVSSVRVLRNAYEAVCAKLEKHNKPQPVKINRKR